jgi:hypothetical protein
LDLVLSQVGSAPTPDVSQMIPTELRAALARAAILQQLGAANPLALLPYDVTF